MWHAGSLGTSTFLICLLVGLLALTCASAVSLTANKPPTEDKLILHLFCIFLCHLDCSSLSWCGEVGWAKQASKHCLEYCFGHLCWERRAWKGMLCLIQYQRKLRQGRKRKGLPMYLVLACRNFRGYHLLLKWFNYPSKQCHSMRWHASSSSLVLRRLQHVCLCMCISVCLPSACGWSLVLANVSSMPVIGQDVGQAHEGRRSALHALAYSCAYCTECSSFAVLFHAGLSQLALMRLWMWCPTTHWSRHMFVIISLIQPVVCCQQCVWPQAVPRFAPGFYNRIIQERLETFTCSLKSFELHSFVSFWTLSSFD